jgi:hypothetical protein
MFERPKENLSISDFLFIRLITDCRHLMEESWSAPRCTKARHPERIVYVESVKLFDEIYAEKLLTAQLRKVARNGTYNLSQFLGSIESL